MTLPYQNSATIPDDIITRYVYPPIPIRNFDWCAFRDGNEENSSKYGWGPTEADAIRDLKENVEE